MTSFVPILFAVTVAALPMVAAADTYKCTVNGKTTYSDQPCGGQSVLLNEHGAASKPSNQEPTSKSANGDAIRARVAAAINEGNLIRAGAMAETAEQKGWVRDAERQAAADAADKRAEVDRKRQIQAMLDATAAADKRAKQRTECYTTTQSFGSTGSADTTCEPARKLGDPLPDLLH